ncbi:MAG: hypothetical protein HYS56_03490 [Candidatus Omnitrophica bacterium]|nr:hypothetical protein [Candidatus Omnitrophota bacterium]
MTKFRTWGLAVVAFFLMAQSMLVQDTEVPLALWFLEQPELSNRMFHHRQELEFDLYLVLLQEETARKGEVLEIAIDELAKTTGLSRKMNRSVYTRILRNALEALEKEYGLVQQSGAAAKGDPKKKDRAILEIVKKEGQERIVLPLEYWLLQWDERFSFAGKLVFLIGLTLNQEAAVNKRGWTVDPAIIQRRFHLSPEVLEKGMLELRKFNLLQVQYHVDPNQPDRLQEGWSLRMLYPPTKIEEAIKKLAKEYGDQRIGFIRQYASVIYAECDPSQIEQMVLLYNRYGDYAFRKTMAVVAEEPHNSPKRSLEYATALLQQEKQK